MRAFIVLALATVAIVTAVCWTLHRAAPQSNRQTGTQKQPIIPETNPIPQAAVTSAPKPLATTAGRWPDYPDFQKRPFPVAQESSRFQWTPVDGKDTNIIRQLAHNDLEYQRMVEENPRISRRQLVYLKETPAAVMEAAKLTGEPIHQLTLPGVDGQELQFGIVKSEDNGSSRRGTFSGRLVGENGSTVTLAFKDGREAFTVLSPKDNLFLVGEPREDGQVIVKAIDPNTYGVGPAGGDDFIKTTNTFKIAQ